ncbi:tRNA (adenosine(37)-N6)-threonylcarbamoyltransferase complex transferase subunit TsaD [Maridesulfovibrio bastinii]|uniref:tRNA (adenosine(37)-N6)-threonylcarbamoyltransferase complex transferase subunit TsaD n=1 Tax=Maridesulfovibrio bastinii TaxID=47157 RepID=UPI00040E7871|nr:tRNA (adenosine(37)-N6)-threonylcarbamoyltransferase complex transferase subunit TsaD [Maridesulfovibrio bastinii]
MLCLGIETSCDETGVALVRDGRLIGEKLATQIDVHALFGGVVPEIASREHLKVLPALFRALIEECSIEFSEIDRIAVARGPGLLGSLLVGVNFAKALSLASNVKVLGVNHLWAHLLSPGLEQNLEFPSLGLLVSGGHTHIYRINSPESFELLGRTLDDAAGEAFDKTAKLLNFPYPGGRLVDEFGAKEKPDKRMFPVPYIHNENLDFSFSGLKTCVANYVNQNPELKIEGMVLPENEESDLSSKRNIMLSSFNYTVGETLKVKVGRALEKNSGIKSLIVAGGVAANSVVRKVMADCASRFSVPLILPPLRLCTDNAAMIAYAGYCLGKRGYYHDLSFEAIPRGRVVPTDWLSEC